MQLLDACNLKCAHCYLDDQPSRMPATEEIKRRLDLIYAFGQEQGVVPDVHLSGGEPTLRRDLVEIVRYTHHEKRGSALLFTNGTRWGEGDSLARALWGSGLRFVQVSLEGPEDLNDAVRGAGVYVSAERTLRMLGEMGFRLTVSITITAHNFDRLFDFVASLDARAMHFHLREVLPLGAGQSVPSLSPRQRRALFEWAIAYDGKSTIGLEDPVHCSVSRAYARACGGGCVAGRNHFCVDVDGVVYPCRPLRLPVGHVGDLSAAWASPEMQRLRARELGGRCGRCELRAHCGGCRVHALARGDVFGEDTRCFAEEIGAVRMPDEQRAIEIATRVGRGVYAARMVARGLLRR